ncbi:hypothetical protein SNE26_15870 [Mucilaginibacter sp. cycad4]|uniref:hypothetical protein n=1 Tax=Mucilaginibacter sp. cycad4 TaxID=3342096 RepID=UPI002AAB946B|nr:hypothetical protein [Mucilaginibacter gossypii]WPU97504.1 hypothetical protein SNE26_15870 [Mucilaginibacter gossypii]
MSEQDFTASHKNNLTIMEATKGHTVYRRVIGNNGERMYYYFENDKLVKMRRADSPNSVVVIDPGR